MKRANLWRFLLILAVVLAALLFLFFPALTGSAKRLVNINLGLDLQGGSQLTLEAQIPEGTSLQEASDILERIVTILNNRVNQYGMTNPVIRRAGTKRIVVELPGTRDISEARQLIGRTALLEFRKVIEAGKKGDILTPTSLNEEVLFDRDGNPYLVEREPMLTGAALSNAVVRTRSTPAPGEGPLYISLEFNTEGARIFREVINQLKAGDQLAIILDNTIYSHPKVTEEIKQAASTSPTLKEAAIEGEFTADEARLLAIVLRAGSLPVDVEIVQESSIGPSLGEDSIRRGMMSMIIGFILVIIYMFLRYRWLGVVGNAALLLNMILVFGALAAFRATLTLDGFAGLVLTIGMSVDANVIIFERIKEELRAGKGIGPAVKAGFQKSYSAILDSNITTIATALVLLLMGTGPVKGFAITLVIGVTGSMFCAIFFSRFLLDTTGLAERAALSLKPEATSA
ncbi:MAG: protein translocase subunit SecD [Candidatus Bipolaricaulia bacterium]